MRNLILDVLIKYGVPKFRREKIVDEIILKIPWCEE